jgi:hypothetical protein
MHEVIRRRSPLLFSHRRFQHAVTGGDMRDVHINCLSRYARVTRYYEDRAVMRRVARAGEGVARGSRETTECRRLVRICPTARYPPPLPKQPIGQRPHITQASCSIVGEKEHKKNRVTQAQQEGRPQLLNPAGRSHVTCSRHGIISIRTHRTATPRFLSAYSHAVPARKGSCSVWHNYTTPPHGTAFCLSPSQNMLHHIAATTAPVLLKPFWIATSRVLCCSAVHAGILPPK